MAIILNANNHDPSLTYMYRYFHHRMITMVRSILVTETFIKATKARIGSSEDGAALTLMSTDIERIDMGLQPLHDIWVSTIQVALASWMLYIRLGVVFVAPIGIVIICFVGLAILMRFNGDSQRGWMAGVQKRVGLTATVIANMKNLKISGLSAPVRDFVQKLRVEELAAASRSRKIIIVAGIFAFSPMLLSPPLAFAFAQRTLDARRMFTSLSYLLLLTNPLSQVFQNIPTFLSGLACLGRIQSFLECESREDFRGILSDLRLQAEKALSDVVTSDSAKHPIVITNGKFGWEKGKYVLQGMNTQISEASLTIVVGPVGSGKSSLCKALLGEIPFSEGSVVLSTRFPHVGFCDQTVFLSNGSIRDNIIGFSTFNEDRYAEVIAATVLAFDFAALPQGDRSNVGSDGITLSGGQKQRVSLARALYLQSDLLILDDIFSGLDADTEEQVFNNVFGPEGLLRRRQSTVVLCTHSIRHLPAADYIIALRDNTIVEQGHFKTLMTGQGYVARLGLEHSSDSDSNSEKTRLRNTTRESRPQMLSTIVSNAISRTPEADGSRQMGDKTVYKHYLKSMGWLLAASMLLFATLLGFFANFPTICESYFPSSFPLPKTQLERVLMVRNMRHRLISFIIGLKFWSDDVYSNHPYHPYAYYAGIYALLQMCAMISLLLLAISIFIVSIRRAGASLHWDALRTLISAPLSFFTATDNGIVTNLFSQDLNLIDTELPNALLNTLFSVSIFQVYSCYHQ